MGIVLVYENLRGCAEVPGREPELGVDDEAEA